MPGTPLRPWNRINYVLIGSDVAPRWELQKSLAENNASYYIDVCVRIEHQRFDLIFIPPRTCFHSVIDAVRAIWMQDICIGSRLTPGEKNLRCCGKPCSASGLLRRHFFRIIILILINPTWLCLNFCPCHARRETFLHLFRPFADSCFQCLALGWKKPYRYHYVEIIPKIPKNSRVVGIIFFFELRVCRNNILLFWGMLRGVSP